MIDIEFDGSKAIGKLDALPARLQVELKAGIGRACIKLAKKVQREKLRGQVLKYRTGRLSRSIQPAPVEVSATQVAGIVSTAVEYAPPHEYGFNATVDVKAHIREIKMAFGRPMPPKQVEVRAHTMTMNLPERSFLRSALREFVAAGVPLEEVNAAILRAGA